MLFQLVNGLVIQATPVLWRDRPPFLHDLQNAPCKFSSNSNQGNVSSHFLLHFLTPYPDLESDLKVKLEQYFLGGLGCASISDSLTSPESLELETMENLDALLKYEWISIFMFHFSVLQYIPLNMMMCLVLFSSINKSHGQHSTQHFTFLSPVFQLLVPH